MKIGDRVTKEKVLNHLNPSGTVIKVTKNYIVVVWDETPGDWHYTAEQSVQLKIINKKEE
jgi:hypothetical protein|tara:strand:- start:31 stop:210 length:180 start_codon:yes stop_codon:yes gene_type:complete